MDVRTLGVSDLVVSRICLGTLSFGDPARRAWTLGEKDSHDILRAALDLGVNFFDTSNSYMQGESERILGTGLRKYARRADVVIASKVGLPFGGESRDGLLSPSQIRMHVEGSLRRLQTDYLDLYQLHRWDPVTPIDDVLRTLQDLVRAGKVRYLGASSMYAWQFAKAHYTAKSCGMDGFVSMQPQYNLVYREEEREVIPFCQAESIGVIPWSPLARGFLSGSRARGSGTTTRSRTDDLERRRYHTEMDYRILDETIAIADARGVSPAVVALGWVLAKPAVTSAIVGVTRVVQLQQAVQALSFRLAQDEMGRLESLYHPRAINDHD